MQSIAKSVLDYLNELPENRKDAISIVRNVILKNLPNGYEETMNWGMISYEIPLERYPDTYNKQPLGLAALASQKKHMSLYLMCVYMIPERMEKLKKGFQEIGVKPNMGKSCVRFNKVEKLPLETIGEIIADTTIENYLDYYEKVKKK
jgi:hypothetical protein